MSRRHLGTMGNASINTFTSASSDPSSEDLFQGQQDRRGRAPFRYIPNSFWEQHSKTCSNQLEIVNGSHSLSRKVSEWTLNESRKTKSDESGNTSKMKREEETVAPRHGSIDQSAILVSQNLNSNDRVRGVRSWNSYFRSRFFRSRWTVSIPKSRIHFF